jgi:hypothetical protein
MVTVRQHGSPGVLYDLKDFIVDLEAFQRQVSHWIVRIDQCTRPASVALEELTAKGAKVSYRAFESLCCAVFQTIDGVFVGYAGDREVVRLVAVDSSFWEITGPHAFEQAMLAKYGEYRR